MRMSDVWCWVKFEMGTVMVWFAGCHERITVVTRIRGFPCGSSWERIHLQCGRPGFDPWVGKIPWRRERLPSLVFWPGEFPGLYSPWGRRKWDTTERLSLTHHPTKASCKAWQVSLPGCGSQKRWVMRSCPVFRSVGDSGRPVCPHWVSGWIFSHVSLKTCFSRTNLSVCSSRYVSSEGLMGGNLFTPGV